MIDFITKNFVTLSAAVVLTASTFGMVFLTAYLTVFDWNLVWLVEYSDVAKFGLMAVAIVSPLLAFISSQISQSHNWLVRKQKGAFIAAVISLAVLLVLTAFDVYKDIAHHTGQTTFHIMDAASLVAAAFLVCFTFLIWDELKTLSVHAVYSYSTIFALALGFFGATYGYYVRDVSDRFDDVVTKNETIAHAKIVMMLSHHIVLLADGKVITIPASDLVKVVAVAPSAKLAP